MDKPDKETRERVEALADFLAGETRQNREYYLKLAGMIVEAGVEPPPAGAKVVPLDGNGRVPIYDASVAAVERQAQYDAEAQRIQRAMWGNPNVRPDARPNPFVELAIREAALRPPAPVVLEVDRPRTRVPGKVQAVTAFGKRKLKKL